MREAENASSFVGRASSVLGGHVEVIEGTREAELAYLAQARSLPALAGKPFVTVKAYAMPNLVAGESVVPELIQDDFTPQSAAQEAIRLLVDPTHHTRAREALRRVRERLGTPGASGRAAAAILELAGRGATSA